MSEVQIWHNPRFGHPLVNFKMYIVKLRKVGLIDLS